MAKKYGRKKGFGFSYKNNAPEPERTPKLVYHFKMETEDERDAKIADAAYEQYLRDPSGARPLDELIAEWEAKDAKREIAKR